MNRSACSRLRCFNPIRIGKIWLAAARRCLAHSRGVSFRFSCRTRPSRRSIDAPDTSPAIVNDQRIEKRIAIYSSRIYHVVTPRLSVGVETVWNVWYEIKKGRPRIKDKSRGRSNVSDILPVRYGLHRLRSIADDRWRRPLPLQREFHAAESTGQMAGPVHFKQTASSTRMLSRSLSSETSNWYDVPYRGRVGCILPASSDHARTAHGRRSKHLPYGEWLEVLRAQIHD